MNPRNQFFSTETCPDKGKKENSNIVIHSRKDRRYKCKTCDTTFIETKGTMYGLKKEHEQVLQVVILLAYGCPVQAIVEAFHLDERNVRAWHEKAGTQYQHVHDQVIDRSDEIRYATGTGGRNQSQHTTGRSLDGTDNPNAR